MKENQYRLPPLHHVGHLELASQLAGISLVLVLVGGVAGVIAGLLGPSQVVVGEGIQVYGLDDGEKAASRLAGLQISHGLQNEYIMT